MDLLARSALHAWPAGAAFLAALAWVAHERRGEGGLRTPGSLLALAVAAALAVMLALAGRSGPHWALLAAGLVIATLARDREQPLHLECGLKLLWVLGPAFALSGTGLQLLALATATPVVAEQWGVLGLGLDPRFLWGTALPLALLVGVVLAGAVPFHFWVADMLQGVRPWLAPLAIASLQATGAAWLAWRLGGIQAFTPAAILTGALLAAAASIAFVAGAATLLVQRRPERRVGTLASLNGALILGALTAAHGRSGADIAGVLGAWSGHLVLALSGAAALARFLPVAGSVAAPGAVLFRRHPLSGLAGLFALFSLAGVPGTPGGALWLETARALARCGRVGVLLALAFAWLAALRVALGDLRLAFGAPDPAPPPERAVPWAPRATLWIAGLGLAALGVLALLPR